ncbi:MAG: single-strand DNA-binding protein [Actinomycetota bacterium]|nr:single-strand DNA-binding protein [Actinomycetota bacterium]
MYEPTVTAAGIVTEAPRRRLLPDSGTITGFRMLVTPRTRRAGGWADGRGTWFTVLCRHSLARNVTASLLPGDRVMVFGKLVCRYQVRDGPGAESLDLLADRVGHDLSWGTATFTPVTTRDPARPPGPCRSEALTPDPYVSDPNVSDPHLSDPHMSEPCLLAPHVSERHVSGPHVSGPCPPEPHGSGPRPRETDRDALLDTLFLPGRSTAHRPDGLPAR